ncbi:MAG: dephospho-CoA kinase [Syntrophomonadaceae bacterium]|jgi:dephospho-CoA kinase|nr:dephospho-CoA kinase [Syntrophomonadaceae bacterium]
MYVIGITGGIASGKSTVARLLRELGMLIIDADEIAREVVQPGQPAWRDIVDHFGIDFLNQDQGIDRAKLGQYVFYHPEELNKLNSFVHPHVINEFRNRLEAIRASQPWAIVGLEVPLLYETNMEQMCDQVWVVWVDYETQLKRLMARDGVDREDAERRIAAQMSLDEKARRAEVVIDNRFTLDNTRQQVVRYFNAIKQAIE